MNARLTEFKSSQLDGCGSCGSSYPESERAYFKRVYGSDHLHQLHDDHQEEAILRYALPWRRAELLKVQDQLTHLKCENDPRMTQPGRSAYSLKQLKDNLSLYCRKQCRSLRWNEHYQAAVKSVADDLQKLLGVGRCLQPISTEAVAKSGAFQKNLDKNAGYFAFETGRRSKGENIQEALEWCSSHELEIAKSGCYGIPLVISHRSSNSKPTGPNTWKWRCRIILMQDIRALLLDGRFAIPFTQLFINCPWGEGGMTSQEVRGWVHRARNHYDKWYSSDYSKFDVSQADWLLEDVIYKVVRPLFGQLSDLDEKLFSAMCYSYINKDIHGFDGVYHAKGCQVSGALTTYAYNTIINEIIDRTVLLMQGCNIANFHSLKCGDDNLTYYKSSEPWDRKKHCELVLRYFGINTTLGENDCGTSKVNPKFLSRTWTDNGEERDIHEVIWNLVYPERYRNYDPAVTHVSVERAEALVLLAACLEQEATMREYFDVGAIYQAAQIERGSINNMYNALAKLGTGFKTPWLNWRQTLTA